MPKKEQCLPAWSEQSRIFPDYVNLADPDRYLGTTSTSAVRGATVLIFHMEQLQSQD